MDTTQENVIYSPGTVEQIEQSKIIVRICSQSACSQCHASKSCGQTEKTEKLIEVPLSDKTPNVSVGDSVIVGVSESQSYWAILVAYLIPFFLVISTLIFMPFFGNYSETTIGLSSLGILIPYYLFLALNKKIFSKKINFYLITVDSSAKTDLCHKI